jgi:hypothetical protein
MLVLLASLGLTCAPRDDSKPADDKAGPGPKVDVPKSLKERIDAALKMVHDRYLYMDSGFWTVFHGILGMGPESARLFDPRTGKSVKAMDYICQGGDVRGMKFTANPFGLEVKTDPGSGVAQGHEDQFIAEMAQWGMPAKRKFVVDGKDHTFQDFINCCRAYTSATQPRPGLPDQVRELSWAIIIISQYFGPHHGWTNSFGEKLTLEDVLRFELDQPIADSPVCGGTHRLFGITWAYHLHRAKDGKKEGIWKDAADRIAFYKSEARKYQNPDGSFSTKYLNGSDDKPGADLRIATTGHVFEWLALAMTDAELREPWMQQAAEALSMLILDNRRNSIDGGALYHAAHGLEIYRTRLFGPGPWPGPLIPLPPAD